MKFPLNGKYSKGEVVLTDGKKYFKKTIKLPEHVDPEKTMKSIYIYRKQLASHGIKTTTLYNHRINKSTGTLILTEKFYNKNLEIIIGTSSVKTVNRLFKLLLKMIDEIYSDGKNPKVVIEVKPSNFLLDGNSLFYCDFVPPRIYKENKEHIKLEFYKKSTPSKNRELRFRFLTKEGAYYYLLLHTLSIRPSFSNFFITKTMAAIKNPALRKSLRKKLSSIEFQVDLEKFSRFYLMRRKAYKNFVRP